MHRRTSRWGYKDKTGLKGSTRNSKKSQPFSLLLTYTFAWSYCQIDYKCYFRHHVQSTSTKEPLYLHCIAEVSSSSDSHHGQQTRSRPDVQDDDLLTTSLDPGHSGPDALVVLLILEAESTSAESMMKESENILQTDLNKASLVSNRCGFLL